MQEPWDDLHDLQYDLRRLVWYTPANPELRNRMPNMDAEPVANHRRPTISVLDGFDPTPGAKSKCDIHTQVPPRVPPRVASLIPPQPARSTCGRGMVGWGRVCDWRGVGSWDVWVRAPPVSHFIVESSRSPCGSSLAPLVWFHRVRPVQCTPPCVAPGALYTLCPALCPVCSAQCALPIVPCTLSIVRSPCPLGISIGELVALAPLLVIQWRAMVC